MTYDPLKRFTDRADDYAKNRPSYPETAIDAVVAGLNPSMSGGRLVAADIGAGTGISTRLLAARGFDVIAIEPNEAMRMAGEASREAHITWSGATGEQTGLAAGSVDLVLCAQSFHWLDAARGLTEFRRILVAHGRVAMLWNVHDVKVESMAAYREVIMRHAVDPPRSPWFRDEPCALGTEVGAAAGFVNYRRLLFENQQVVDEAGLIGRAMSSSYCPKIGPGREGLERELRGLFARFAHEGTMTMRYVCEVHMAERGA